MSFPGHVELLQFSEDLRIALREAALVLELDQPGFAVHLERMVQLGLRALLDELVKFFLARMGVIGDLLATV